MSQEYQYHLSELRAYIALMRIGLRDRQAQRKLSWQAAVASRVHIAHAQHALIRRAGFLNSAEVDT